MTDFFSHDRGWFVVTKELFEASINWKYHVQKNTLRFERNMDRTPEICITNLIDAGYVHSPHLSKPGSYKKEGDTLSIRTFFDEQVVALNFFDTIIDEILVFDTHGSFLFKKDSISLSSIADNREVETVETRDISENGELFHFLENTQVIFIDLDFWEPLEKLAKTCQKSIIFAGSTAKKSIDIGIREIKIGSLQELETIVKNFGKNVFFHTKHTKVLENFLEYNNLVSGGIKEMPTAGLQSFVM